MEKKEKTIVTILLIFSVAIIFFAIGFTEGARAIRSKENFLEEEYQYITMRFDKMDLEMEAVDRIIDVLEEFQADVDEILSIKGGEVDYRVRFKEEK